MISQVLFTSEQRKKHKMAFFCRYIVTCKVALWATSYSACVVYTKTIIHLIVGESGGYLPHRFVLRQFFIFSTLSNMIHLFEHALAGLTTNKKMSVISGIADLHLPRPSSLS